MRQDAVGPLYDQIEDSIVPPVLSWVQKGEVAEDHAETHERERGGKPHHDRDHNEAQHRQTERGIAHDFFCSSSLIARSCATRASMTVRWRAASAAACAVCIAVRRDSSSTYSL